MPKPPDMDMYVYIHEALAGVSANRAAILYQSTDPDGGLPDDFLTYYLVAGNPEGHFSNKATRENCRYSVQCAHRDRSQLEPKGKAIRAAMEQAGFLYITTSSDQTPTDSKHWSRTLDFRYIEEVRT